MKEQTNNGGLTASEKEKIRAKYAELIEKVIEANLRFPEELKDCMLSSSMIEKIMFEFEYHFLILEFGLCFTDFPEDFQNACIELHEEFQKDFPYASVVDDSKPNNYITTNYRAPLDFIYFMAEYDEPREIIRDVTKKLIEEFQLTPVLQKYKVIAENAFIEQEYRIVLKFYVRKFNSYPCILMSRPISGFISREGLRKLEKNYEEIAYMYEWGNEVDYEQLVEGYFDLSVVVPELPEGLRYSLIVSNLRYGKLVFSDEIEMPKLKNYYGLMPFSQEMVDQCIRMERIMSKFPITDAKPEIETESTLPNSTDIFEGDDDDLPF